MKRNVHQAKPIELSLGEDVALRSIPSAVTSSRLAQVEWTKRTVRKRLQVLRRFRRMLAAHGLELAQSFESGQSRGVAEILSAEILPSVAACEFLERRAERLLRPRRLGRRGRPAWLGGIDSEIRREPFGVVLVIGPSNYPWLLPGIQALQALAAGNAVMIKPGRGGTRAACAFRSLLLEAGLDARLVRVLPEAIEAVDVVLECGVDKVFLTGSTTSGEAILRKLSPKLVPATVELSGCDPMMVLPDADLGLVVRALLFGLRLNRGATCIAPRRVYVSTALATELEGRLSAALTMEPPTTVEPETCAKLRPMLEEAVGRGAHFVAGGFGPDQSIFGPVVLAGATPPLRLLDADIFAPLLTLITVADDEEALAGAASSRYALGATIFGGEKRARELSARLPAGVVVINDLIVPTADPRIPFGGRKRSGFGLTRGEEGLLEMTQAKSIIVQRRRFLPHLEPGLPGDDELFATYLAAAHGHGLVPRARAWLKLFKLLARRGPGPARSTNEND